MTYAYRVSDTDITAATRRLARKRAKHALAALSGGEPPAEALHTARKDAKKLRALLKLVGPGLPNYKAENIALRDGARAVSPLRDHTAMLEAFDRIAPPGSGDTRFAPVRAALADRPPVTLDETALVDDFAARFTAADSRSARSAGARPGGGVSSISFW